MTTKKGSVENNHSKKIAKLLGFIFVSILIHLILVILFFQHGFHKKAMSLLASLNQELTQEQQKQRAEQIKKKRDAVMAGLQRLKPTDRDNRPAQLRAPKSNFGWVLFDEPSVKRPINPNVPMEIPTSMDGAVGESLLEQATEEEKSDPVEEEKQEVTNQSIARPTLLPDEQPEAQIHLSPADQNPDKNLEQPAHITQEVMAEKHDLDVAQNPVKEIDQEAEFLKSEIKTPDKTLPEMASTSFPAPEQETKNVAQRIADIKALHEKLATFTPPSAQITSQDKQVVSKDRHEHKNTQAENKEEQSGSRSVRVRGANSIDQKSKRNIIALTKGFIEKMHGDEGTDLIDRDGDPDKRPTFEELKYLSYESKINWCLQASWKQNFCFSRTREQLEGNATIEFTLDEFGNVTNCTLLQSSGHTELDTMVLRNMKIASPFPPIPKHFGTKTYTTGRVIQIRYNNFNF